MAQPPKNITAFSFVEEKIACGKPTCGTCGGVHLRHGPYWYAYFTKKDKSTGKVYVGKDPDAWRSQWGIDDPAPKTHPGPTVFPTFTDDDTTKAKKAAPPKKAKAAPKAAKAPEPEPAAPPKKAGKAAAPKNPDWQKMLSRAATPMTAARILGVAPGVTRSILTAAFRQEIGKAHPDKGGDQEHAAAVNAAYAMLKKLVK